MGNGRYYSTSVLTAFTEYHGRVLHPAMLRHGPPWPLSRYKGWNERLAAVHTSYAG